jgi:hypothetical protein
MARESRPAVGGPDSDAATRVELVNRTIDRGVALRGEVMIQVADVDLVALSLHLVLRGVEGEEADQEPDADEAREGP